MTRVRSESLPNRWKRKTPPDAQIVKEPNLSAAVADITRPTWRGSASGIYRFWRDLGYGKGALGWTAHISGPTEAASWFVALFVSGAVLVGQRNPPSSEPDP